MITVMAMATSASREASKSADTAGVLKRTAWLIALALVAVLMLRQSLAYVVRPADPGLALRIDPGNAEVAASRAEQLLRENPANRAEAEAVARRALRRSPVSAAGARMIATARDVAGDPVSARRLMAYSERLSRRDLPTQVWLIQDAVQHNDVARALHHYDIALRSSDASKALLFPVLIKALDQPDVVRGLVDILTARPNWGPSFLEQTYAAPNLDGFAALLRGLGARGYGVPPDVLAGAEARMVDAGRYEAAWQIYGTRHAHAARLAVRDPDFSRLGTSDGPFGWTILAGNGVSVEPRRFAGNDTLAYRAATGSGGVLARQLLILPAGTFRLSGVVPDIAEGSPPILIRLRCAGSDVPISTITAGAPSFTQAFSVPQACRAQWLDLVAEAGENPVGTSGAIGGLRITQERPQG